MFVHPTQATETFGSCVSKHFGMRPSIDSQVKFYRDHPRETPPNGKFGFPPGS